jgi:hypothetical protein
MLNKRRPQEPHEIESTSCVRLIKYINANSQHQRNKQLHKILHKDNKNRDKLSRALDRCLKPPPFTFQLSAGGALHPNLAEMADDGVAIGADALSSIKLD